MLSTTHLSTISCDVLHVLALSHVHVSSPIETTGGQADASCSRIAAPRGSVGVSHISQLSWHMSFSYHKSYSSLQLNVESGFGALLGTFFSLSLPKNWLSRSTPKIDALDDDETERGQAAVRCSRKSAVLGSASSRLASPRKAVFLSSSTEQ